MEKGKRAVIYARISQNREGDASKAERQITRAAGLAKVREYDLVAEPFTDDDVSAYKGKAKRPQYEALIEFIESGEVDVVLCWAIDRLLRSTKEMLKFIELAERTGVRLESVQGGDLDLNTPAGRMVATILASVAQAESEMKAERHLLKNQQTRAKGGSTGGPVPFGWTHADGALHDVEGPALTKATLDIITGSKLSEIAREWNANGLTTVFRNPWNQNSVKKVLIRPRNAGLVDHGGVVVDGVKALHDPAVTVDEWKACLAVLMPQSRPQAPRRHLLSNLLTCTKCGNKMVAGISTVTSRGKRYVYPVFKHQGVKGCGSTIRLDITNETVAVRLRLKLLTTKPEDVAPKTSDLKRAIRLRSEQSDINTKLSELEDLFTAGEFSAAGYRKARSAHVERSEAIAEALANITKDNAFASLLGASVWDTNGEVTNAMSKFEALDLSQRRLILSTLFPSIRIGKGKGVERITIIDANGEVYMPTAEAAVS